jgi:hypothetical protein
MKKDESGRSDARDAQPSRRMTGRHLLVRVAAVLALSAVTASAGADTCIDASDEARALLARRQLVEARARLRLCAASSCDESVRSLCDDRLAEVTARLPTIIFDVKDRDGRDLTDVALTVDAAPSAEGAIGNELTLDPGPHAFVFSVAGAEPVELRVVLVERDKGRREHVVLGRAREEVLASPKQNDTPRSERPLAPSPWQTAGWITLGASAVGIGIGTAFGFMAIANNDDAHCDASNVCADPRARHDARVAAGVSTVSFVAGGVLAASGITLLLVAPKTAARAANASVLLTSRPGGGALMVTSAW